MKAATIVLVFCAVFCLMTALLYTLKKGDIAEKKRLDRMLDAAPRRRERRDATKKRRDGEAPARKGMEKLADQLYVAGIALRPEEFIAIWAGAAVLVPAAAVFFGISPTAAIALAIVGAAGPIGMVKYKRHQRLAMFDKQLIDALNIMTNSLRAGVSFQTAMQNISKEMEEPISKEFGRVYREGQMGVSLELSLQRLVERTENSDLDLVCSAVLIQKQIGGNLATVLENISGTIADRIKLRGEVKTLTASGTMSGYIIGALPIVLLVALMFLNPSYIETFFQTQPGRIMLMLSVALETVGFIFVRKIVNIKM